jgi:hypothetical protein
MPISTQVLKQNLYLGALHWGRLQEFKSLYSRSLYNNNRLSFITRRLMPDFPQMLE